MQKNAPTEAAVEPVPKMVTRAPNQPLITSIDGPFSASKPAAAGCNSNKAVMNDRLVRAVRFLDMFQGLKPLAESLRPFGTIN